MKILVINCGSSSIKYKLFEMGSNTVLVQGGIERIGIEDTPALIKHASGTGKEFITEEAISGHQAGINRMFAILVNEKYGILSSLNEINAVGHRVVHGGEKFNKSVLITADVVKEIEACVEIAPLHNPPNLEGIRAVTKLLPAVPQVAVFDTAFHQTMPQEAYMYGIPYSLYEKYGIRRYGFHGTSHRYVSRKACENLGLEYENTKIISCHLGGGASIAAIKNGKSVDTSMGFTPIEGLVMGTRTGDLDAGAITFIMDKEKLDTLGASNLFNKESGMLGLSGVSSDMRDIEKAANENNERAQMAIEVYCYKIKKYIGSYIAALGGVDVVVFTGGIGENTDIIRAGACKGMEFLGIEIDESKNKGLRGKTKVISKEGAKATIIVVPTDEEFMIASDTYEIVNKK